ncbi:protein DOWNY MILDEW RESISTANCE 6 [Cajanus cajan]|uniref:Hyoscyamine 6-dioxygenase n=1 Tax=Cajanus cajan TaxID=3821 RepID=A0A151R3I7_CAJCA|nr:protein DOWNY MILDEW RESISTANCE 6 [Cajanus cajan]KYP37154.1 Hyoscyamine 6-dioxygenase [Cajanus cajan]
MESKLLSSWYNLESTVPSSYVQPPDRRPGNAVLATGLNIPVIDLQGQDHDDIVRNIIKSSEEFGFFQVINHGVAKEVMDGALGMFKEFHGMPPDEKIRESSKDPNGSCKLYTSSGRNVQETLYWKDSLQHPCYGEFLQFWPEKPQGYREVIGKYTQELRTLGLKILDLISEGLGLGPEYFHGNLTANPVMLSHHYPPCPEPSLTLGTSRHKDPNLLTILLQQAEISALQVFKDGAWIPVEPIPNAFVVNMGFMLQIISNGKLIGAEHRVVTNSNSSRHTIAYFINPTKETLIEPAKPLLNATSSAPIYRSMTFGELLGNFLSKGPYFEPELRI